MKITTGMEKQRKFSKTSLNLGVSSNLELVWYKAMLPVSCISEWTRTATNSLSVTITYPCMKLSLLTRITQKNYKHNSGSGWVKEERGKVAREGHGEEQMPDKSPCQELGYSSFDYTTVPCSFNLVDPKTCFGPPRHQNRFGLGGMCLANYGRRASIAGPGWWLLQSHTGCLLFLFCDFEDPGLQTTISSIEQCQQQ